MSRLAIALLSFLAAFTQPAVAARPDTVGNTIVLGQSGVYSGPLGAYAQDNIAVINTYFESINARGGIHGFFLLPELVELAVMHRLDFQLLGFLGLICAEIALIFA